MLVKETSTIESDPVLTISSVVAIQSVKLLTPDVVQIVTEKPKGFSFKPGQATLVSINKKDLFEETAPFTFTSIPTDEYLEFTVKIYAEHKSITQAIKELIVGDELILHGVFGSIEYKGEGVFIAGGAGVTPFLSIFRALGAKREIGKNKLIFANKTIEDIIHGEEFEEALGSNFVNILSEEKANGYATGLITESFLNKHISSLVKHIYLCGPPIMMESVLRMLSNMGVNKQAIVVEQKLNI